MNTGLWDNDFKASKKQLSLIDNILKSGIYTTAEQDAVVKQRKYLTKSTASALITQMLEDQKRANEDKYAYGLNYDTRYEDECDDLYGEFRFDDGDTF
jgi:hypothetical protein